MGNTLKRALVTVPLAVALAVAGTWGTAQAAAPAPAHAARAAAQLSGLCTIYANGVAMWSFVTTAAGCAWTAAELQQTAPGYFISYTWFPLG